MPVAGTVRAWHDERGWGVVDSPATPGGCWAHYSAVAVAGYRSLAAGAAVQLEFEVAAQDGYAFRAMRVWPAGTDPVDTPVDETGSAYRSELIISFDPPPRDPSGQ